MSITTVASLSTLMQLAKKLGDARRSGNQAEIYKAQAEHDAYAELCLRADKMNTGITRGFIDEGFNDYSNSNNAFDWR